MYCPQCKSEVNCGCKSCLIRSPNKPGKLIREGNNETCPACGFSADEHDWLDIEYEQYIAAKKRLNENT